MIPEYKSYKVNVNLTYILAPFKAAKFFYCCILGSSIFYLPNRSYKYFLF